MTHGTDISTLLRRIGAAITKQLNLRWMTPMPPIKPLSCIVGDKIRWFMGADYKDLDLQQAKYAVAELQSRIAALSNKMKREQRARRKAGA